MYLNNMGWDNDGHYRPLPDTLTIKESIINGLGLFAVKDIPKDSLIGVTHVYDEKFKDGLIRTPLGGFFNHSEEPNIRLEDVTKVDGEKWTKVMISLRDIKSGDEITGKYTTYDPTK
jgi:SET domain-containing protein